MYSPHLLFPSSWLSIISLLDLSLPPSLFASFLRRSSVKFLSLLVYRYCDLFLWFLSRYYLCIFFFWILHLICLGIIFCCCFSAGQHLSLFGVFWASWTCDLVSDINLGAFSVVASNIVSSEYFYLVNFLLNIFHIKFTKLNVKLIKSNVLQWVSCLQLRAVFRKVFRNILVHVFLWICATTSLRHSPRNESAES